MSRRWTAVTVGMLAMSLSLLVGCTPTGTSTSASPSNSAVPSTSPSAQSAVPTSRFSISCDELAPLTAVAELIGPPAAPIAPFSDSTAPGGSLDNMSNLAHNALLQAGALECAWTDDGRAPALHITLIPDAASEFSALVPSLFGLPAVTGIGDKAYGGCLTSGMLKCGFQVLVGSTWISVTPNELSIKTPTAQSITDLTRKVLAALAASPAPSPRWTPPSSSAGTSVSCATLLSAQQLAGFGLPPGKDLHGHGYFDGYLGDAAIAIVGGRACAWGGTTTLIVPGASWAWASHGPLSNTSIAMSPVAGLGDAAQVGCATAVSECTAQILVGPIWVGIDGPFSGVDAIVAFAKVELSAMKAG